jgi:putative two-component system response regulator
MIASNDSRTKLDALLGELCPGTPGTSPVGQSVKKPANTPAGRRRIMIVDDEAFNIKLIHKQLTAAGYSDFVTTTEPRKVVPMVLENAPDVLLLDVVMPGVSGLDILKAIRENSEVAHLPIIMVTASNDRAMRDEALELGATDFLGKPLDPTELLPRVRNALVLKSHYDHLRSWADELERQVRKRTSELEASRLELIYCLGRAAEYRDNETGRHIVRVGKYVALIARKLGLHETIVAVLEQTAPLHDMGKIGIPDAILLKPGKLTASESQLMREHSAIGQVTLDPMAEDDSEELRNHTQLGKEILSAGQSPFLRVAARIALTHHEKWDGSGYPLGLKGEQIPLEGRITAVADVFDALSTSRPYKRAFELDECFQMLQDERGKHFDPEVLDAFLACREAVVDIAKSYADPEETGPQGFRLKQLAALQAQEPGE